MSDSAIHSIAGAAGGIVAMSATYPLIFLSTRAAVETKKESKSTYQAVVDIIKREGITGLYSGLESSLLGIAVTNGVYYYFYERSREIILRSKGPGVKALSTLDSMLTGLIAGSATTLISNPIWVIQTSQAVHTMGKSSETPVTTKKPNFLEAARTIIAKNGVAAFWRGIGPALVLVINPIIQYTAFEQLKNLLIARRTNALRAAGGAVTAVAVLSDWDFFFLGALSKLAATSATYPYIVVKSRLQAGSSKYKSALDGLLTILKEEGIEGLYKGIGSKIIQSVLTAAILFAGQRRIFEMTKKALSPVLAQ